MNINQTDLKTSNSIHILTKTLKMTCFITLLYIMYLLFYVFMNFFMILPELLLIISFIAIIIFKYQHEKTSNDMMKRLRKMKIFTMLSFIVWMLLHQIIKMTLMSDGILHVTYYLDVIIYGIIIYVGLSYRKYDMLMHQAAFEKGFKLGLLDIIKSLIKLLIILLMIGLILFVFGYYVLSNIEVSVDILLNLLIHFGLFVFHYGLFVLFEYISFLENLKFQETKKRSYTTKFALIVRVMVFILVFASSILYLIASYYRYIGSYFIDLNQSALIYLLSLEISILNLIFYATFFSGILKLKKPGNQNISYIIMIIVFDFFINFLIGITGLLGLQLNRMASFASFLSILGLFQTINGVLLLFVGLAVYDYFKKHRFPKAKYFLYAVLFQPLRYVFNFFSMQFATSENYVLIGLIQQVFVVVLIIVTSSLSIYTIYHMTKEKTEVIKIKLKTIKK